MIATFIVVRGQPAGWLAGRGTLYCTARTDSRGGAVEGAEVVVVDQVRVWHRRGRRGLSRPQAGKVAGGAARRAGRSLGTRGGARRLYQLGGACFVSWDLDGACFVSPAAARSGRCGHPWSTPRSHPAQPAGRAGWAPPCARALPETAVSGARRRGSTPTT
jgi:hypothetical protein